MKARMMAGVVAVMMAVSFAAAQDFMTSVAPGSKAMLFELNGLDNLGAGDFEGGIGGKYYLSNAMAIRASLQFGMFSQDEPSNADASAVPPETGIDGEYSATQLGIAAAVEYHLLTGRVSPYVGGGVGFSMTSTDDKYADVGTAANPPVSVEVKNDEDGYMGQGVFNGIYAGTDIIFGGLAGVEFFITKEISLSAEYQLAYTIHSSPDMEVIIGQNTQKTEVGGFSVFGVGSANTGNLTLSVYF
jgi:opacity protein-like surface antigen